MVKSFQDSFKLWPSYYKKKKVETMLVLIKITPWDIKVLIAEDTALCVCNFGKWGACFYSILKLLRTVDRRPHASSWPKTHTHAQTQKAKFVSIFVLFLLNLSLVLNLHSLHVCSHEKVLSETTFLHLFPGYDLF